MSVIYLPAIKHCSYKVSLAMPDEHMRRARASLRPSTRPPSEISRFERRRQSTSRPPFNIEFRTSSLDSPGCTRMAECLQSLGLSDPAAAGQILTSLSEHESRLYDWFERSPTHVEWFARDPLGALQAANLGVDKALLMQLEDLLKSLEKK